MSQRTTGLSLASWAAFLLIVVGLLLLLLGVDAWVGTGCISHGPGPAACPLTTALLGLIVLGLAPLAGGVTVLVLDRRTPQARPRL